MAFFDRLNEMAKTVSEKTNDSLEINKLIGEINLTKGNIQSFQRELGEHFWAKFVTGEQFDDEAMMICDKIVAAQDKIHDMEAQIAQIKAEGEARKAEREAELKQFYAARRKLTGEFPDGKVDMKKLTEEYDELEQAHNTTYGEFKTVRDDLHRLWKVKSCVDTAARFNERTEEQLHQNRPQTRHKKEDISR